MLAGLEEMVAEAERFGVLVGVEGVAQFVASSPKRIRRMLQAVGSNNLQIVFDPVNLLSANNWQEADRIIEECFQLFGDRIAVLHAKDFLFEGGRICSVPLGRGKLNYRLLLGLLKQRKPLLNVIMEDTQPATIDASRDHLQSVFAAL
jgi:sugar phosphate isomerase/epimerase